MIKFPQIFTAFKDTEAAALIKIARYPPDLRQKLFEDGREALLLTMKDIDKKAFAYAKIFDTRWQEKLSNHPKMALHAQFDNTAIFNKLYNFYVNKKDKFDNIRGNDEAEIGEKIKEYAYITRLDALDLNSLTEYKLSRHVKTFWMSSLPDELRDTHRIKWEISQILPRLDEPYEFAGRSAGDLLFLYSYGNKDSGVAQLQPVNAALFIALYTKGNNSAELERALFPSADIFTGLKTFVRFNEYSQQTNNFQLMFLIIYCLEQIGAIPMAGE